MLGGESLRVRSAFQRCKLKISCTGTLLRLVLFTDGWIRLIKLHRGYSQKLGRKRVSNVIENGTSRETRDRVNWENQRAASRRRIPQKCLLIESIQPVITNVYGCKNSAADLRPGRTRANGRDTVSISGCSASPSMIPPSWIIRPLALTLFQRPKVSKYSCRVVNSETTIKVVEMKRLSLRTFWWDNSDDAARRIYQMKCYGDGITKFGNWMILLEIVYLVAWLFRVRGSMRT